MPLNPQAGVSNNIKEFHTGKAYAHTAAKFGKKTADRQAIAVAMSVAKRDIGGGVFNPPTPPGMPPMVGQLPTPNGIAAPMMGPPPGSPNPAINAASANPAITPPASSTPIGVAQNAGQIPMGMPPAGINPSATPVNNPMARPLMATGGALNRASGGMNMASGPHLAPGWQTKAEARGMTKGAIFSAVPGRTDHHDTHVPSGSYVVPADIVSGRGQGNTIAGANVLHQMFKMGPFGSPAMGMHHGPGAPRPVVPHPAKFHSGGGKHASHIGTPTPVKLAGGEVVIPPENLMHVVHPNLNHAHKIMDQWILNERRNLRKTLAKLPGPAKD